VNTTSAPLQPCCRGIIKNQRWVSRAFHSSSQAMLSAVTTRPALRAPWGAIASASRRQITFLPPDGVSATVTKLLASATRLARNHVGVIARCQHGLGGGWRTGRRSTIAPSSGTKRQRRRRPHHDDPDSLVAYSPIPAARSPSTLGQDVGRLGGAFDPWSAAVGGAAVAMEAPSRPTDRKRAVPPLPRSAGSTPPRSRRRVMSWLPAVAEPRSYDNPPATRFTVLRETKR